jgi:hypothetical protein
MQPIRYLLIICALCWTCGLSAQNQPVAEKPNRGFVVYAGAGPCIFFNNLVIAKDHVNEFNYAFAGRVMWEPEHLLSLGIESGYYCRYTVDFGSESDVNISNYGIPIHIVVGMKFLKRFYFNFASGQTILLNKVTNTQDSDVNSSVLSLGDLSGSLGYKFKIKDRLSMAAETKFYYSSKLNDKNLAFLFMGWLQALIEFV